MDHELHPSIKRVWRAVLRVTFFPTSKPAAHRGPHAPPSKSVLPLKHRDAGPIRQASGLILTLLTAGLLGPPQAGQAAADAEEYPWTGQPVVGRNADGHLEVFRVDADGELRHRWQKFSNGSWSAWSSLLGSLLQQGAGVILVSSYLPEIYELADTLHVFRSGAIVATHSLKGASHETILTEAIGV